MVQKQPAPRGRPRQYDPEAALDCAMEVFWTRSFAGTSLDDVEAAMGMSRPSIYAAFGDKHELFIKSLRLYQSGLDNLRHALAAERPLHESLRNVFSLILARYLSGERSPRGCLMFSVAVTESVQDATIAAVVAEAVRTLDAAFETRFKAARDQGELEPTAEPAILARLATGLVHTLSVRARAGEKKDALQRVIDAFLIVLCNPGTGARRSTAAGASLRKLHGGRQRGTRFKRKPPR